MCSLGSQPPLSDEAISAWVGMRLLPYALQYPRRPCLRMHRSSAWHDRPNDSLNDPERLPSGPHLTLAL
jgi:hypothetical protein